jgi:hypothetical protein
MIHDEDGCAEARDGTLTRRLKRLGFRCDDVGTVILVELRHDRVGRLADVFRDEKAAAGPEWSLPYSV